MKFLKLCTLLLIVALSASAQKVEVDKKTGLVTVDGQPSFHLVAKKKVLWQSDYALENLDGKELAYLKAEEGEKWNNATRSYEKSTFYGITFTQSGNYCQIRDYNSLSVIKSLAKEIAAARLVQNGAISPEAEQKFVVMHKGQFLLDPNATPAVVVNVGNGQQPVAAEPTDKRSSAPANISVSGDNIYNNDELIGNFRSKSEGGFMVLDIYSRDDSKVATARHKENSIDDWEVILSNGSKISLRYYANDGEQRLLKYLVEKGYL